LLHISVDLQADRIVPIIKVVLYLQFLTPSVSDESLLDPHNGNAIVAEVDVSTAGVVRQHELEDIGLGRLISQPVSGEAEPKE
jgi:hypothetical protein